MKLARPIIQTPNGKLFAIRHEKEPGLSEWDGRRWIRHPFPDKVQLWGECRITTDTRNRIWFIDQSYNADPVLRPTLIFDPADGKFIHLSSFRSALQSQAAKLAGTRLGDVSSPAAVFAADGRVSYTERNSQVNYFDGQTWRSWQYHQIVNNGMWGTGERVPFFGDDGKLAMDFNGKNLAARRARRLEEH